MKPTEKPVTASAESQQAPAFSAQVEETAAANRQDGVHEAAASSVTVMEKPRAKDTAVAAKQPGASFTANTTVAEMEGNVPKASGLRDQTVLLDEGELLGTASKHVKNYLIAEADGKENELEADNIIIGRSPKAAQLIDTGVGVSRSHVELVKLSDTYGVKDLGSKNGTFFK
ncbi:FHA domain-containing protein [Virgibacillus halophilus]|uniref:FHA domain-containing protein n=1 Tax=Tigheibacillus halophilus TaxID=361280 RepID=A0ABU5C8D0_9BACI|nr:FHA domain-containing protein [Virgibacillus halophilus]